MKRLPIIPCVIAVVIITLLPHNIAVAARDDGYPDGGVLNYGEYGRPVTLDPITSNDMISLRVSELVFNGLTAINEKQEVVPDLAERDRRLASER